MRKRMRLSVCVVALALLLTAGAAQAAPAASQLSGEPSLLGAAWGRMVEWLEHSVFFAFDARQPSGKAGCGMDPDGVPCPAAAPADQLFEGCDMDPNGRCLPAAAPADQPFEGCDMDPFGRCLPAPGA